MTNPVLHLASTLCLFGSPTSAFNTKRNYDLISYAVNYGQKAIQSTRIPSSLHYSILFVFAWLLATIIIRMVVGMFMGVLNRVSGAEKKKVEGDKSGRREQGRLSSNQSLASLGSMSELVRFDNGRGDDDKSVDSASDSITHITGLTGLTSALFGNFRAKGANPKNNTPRRADEEEGSYVSKESSTGFSIRSRFSRNSSSRNTRGSSRGSMSTFSSGNTKSSSSSLSTNSSTFMSGLEMKIKHPFFFSSVRPDDVRHRVDSLFNDSEKREHRNHRKPLKQDVINRPRKGVTDPSIYDKMLKRTPSKVKHELDEMATVEESVMES